jgi:hypothetical protein
MGSDEFRLPAAAVLQHSDGASAAAEAVRQARAAVTQIAMDSQAYGQLCQFLPAMLGLVFEAAVVAMNGSAEALQETALNLRSAVSAFEQTDESAARRLAGPP